MGKRKFFWKAICWRLGRNGQQTPNGNRHLRGGHRFDERRDCGLSQHRLKTSSDRNH